jgi:putative photosynthetic complex assembly protein
MQQQGTHEITGIHRLPLLGALAVGVFAVLAVVVSVAINGPVSNPATNVAQERYLYLLDENEGELAVYDARTKEPLGRFNKGEGAFVRISIRSLFRMRTLKEIDPNQPFRLVETSNGDLRITDPQSGDGIRVNAFGPIAIESFSKFLPNHHSIQGAKG